MATRAGDNADMALMALVDQAKPVEAKAAEGEKKKPKARRKKAAEPAAEAAAEDPRRSRALRARRRLQRPDRLHDRRTKKPGRTRLLFLGSSHIVRQARALPHGHNA